MKHADDHAFTSVEAEREHYRLRDVVVESGLDAQELADRAFERGDVPHRYSAGSCSR